MRSLALERMSAELPDEHLVNAARAGDRAAFSALFARDRDLVYAYAYARLLNREDAEDAMQETFYPRLPAPGTAARARRMASLADADRPQPVP